MSPTDSRAHLVEYFCVSRFITDTASEAARRTIEDSVEIGSQSKHVHLESDNVNVNSVTVTEQALELWGSKRF